MSYFQAIVIALVQGFTELFPVSSLGHSVLVPAWLGGSWETLVTQSSQSNSGSSFYLAFIVALHVGTACALLWFFRADWIRIVSGFLRSFNRSLRDRQFSVRDSDERLAWLIVFATIPVGLTGVTLEHTFRTLLAKPVAASIFLTINGLILLAAERLRRHDEAAAGPRIAAAHATPPLSGGSPELGPADAALHASRRGARSLGELEQAYASDVRISGLPYSDAIYVGVLQILSLFAGISRAGVSMAGGLWRGLDREDAARFAFLLATPVILAAGVLKLPSLFGHAGDHVRGQAAVGVLVTGAAAYVSVRFLVRYFRTRTLTPFAIYCLLAGTASLVRFTAF
jgi:undecaprenyl-diphosphatase